MRDECFDRVVDLVVVSYCYDYDRWERRQDQDHGDYIRMYKFKIGRFPYVKNHSPTAGAYV